MAPVKNTTMTKQQIVAQRNINRAARQASQTAPTIDVKASDAPSDANTDARERDTPRVMDVQG